MVLQIVLLPVYLMLFAGADTVQHIEVAPFVEAFVILIAIPLGVAALVQALSRRHVVGQAIENVVTAAMVPLMMLTLAVVIGSQISAVGGQLVTLVRLVPLYAAFLAAMLVVGIVAGRIARLRVPEIRAVIFSGATRNSLVVLPLALAMPGAFAIAPLAVVTQTLVELVGMVIFVRLVPAVTKSAVARLPQPHEAPER
ncbi:MAG: hypothetical protein ABWY57_05400 [Mycetocola sp.]